MLKKFTVFIGYFLLLTIVVACSSEEGLRPFASDGCSLFPDASVINNDDWCECCVEHDIAYWQGGTSVQRETADLKLKQCVLDKTNDAVLANVMFEGVRFGGSPYFYNWYRWGYGWSYARKYQALTSKEQTIVQQLLSDFHQSENTACN